VGDLSRCGLLVVTLSTLGSGGGCTKTFEASVRQPNPLAHPSETLQTSEELVILTGDMELRVPAASAAPGGTQWVDQRYPITNKASFTVVSRDRLRFHVQVEHKWQEYTELKSWDSELVDDQGRHFRPEVERAQGSSVVKVWDYETRSVSRDQYGDITAIHSDGWKNRQQLGSLVLYRGRADLVFYSRDLLTPGVRSLTLYLRRGATEFKFTWEFAEGEVARAVAPPGRRAKVGSDSAAR
jgi:hypothetical protein